MGPSSRRWLNQSTQVSVANSTASKEPRPPTMDDLSLVEAVYRLGQGVVTAVTDAADRGLDTCLGEARSL